MKNLCIALIGALLLTLSWVVAAESGVVTATDFLKRARSYRGVESYAVSEGTLHYRSADKKTATKGRVYLANLFTPEAVKAQLVLDGLEGYMITQKYNGEPTDVKLQNKNLANGGKLAQYGLQVADLAMSFLYWDLVQELPGESLRTVFCRKFELKSPDDKEIAQVYISDKYLFPVRAEFFRLNEDGTREATRSLEVSSFRKQGDFYVISRLVLWLDKKWRCEIIFDRTVADYVAADQPVNIFKTIK
ncbi:MAG: hypothetical protein RRY34_04465 [Victivallaceae bacterium]